MKNLLFFIPFLILLEECNTQEKQTSISYDLSLEVAMYDSVQVFVNNIKNELGPRIYVLYFDSKRNDTISYGLTTIRNEASIDSKYKDYLYFRNRDRSLLIVQPNDYLQFCNPAATNKLKYLKGISFIDTPVSNEDEVGLIGLIAVNKKVFVDYHFLPEKIKAMVRPPVIFTAPPHHRHTLSHHNHKN
ncbi:MAG: hypothetical protein ACTHJ0_17325 [Flavipsychrobacter sp.]